MPFSLQSAQTETDVIMIEDDGRVGYAYYYSENKIVGFVWLYNIADAPLTTEEQQGVEGPLNPQSYVRDTDFTPPATEDDFDFNWVFREGVWECGIYIRNKLHAVLGKSDKPGWCVLANQDGPLAHRLEWAEESSR